MKKAENIIGFLVLDEGKAVRDFGGDDPEYQFANWTELHYPIAVFVSRRVARRVKDIIQRKWKKLANEFDPATEEMRFNLWTKRAASVRVARAQRSLVAVPDLRTKRKQQVQA